MSRATEFAAVTLFCVAACGNTNTGTLDMSMSGDMVMKPADMTLVDMTFVPPTFDATGCATANVTLSGSMLYTNIIQPKCATTGCHVAGATPPNYAGGAAAFSQVVVNKSAFRSQLPSLQYIKPNDLNNSFILYKVAGQQGKIPEGGGQMPQNGPPFLSATEQCTLINWVRSGAT
jgi:hypothetical protein